MYRNIHPGKEKRGGGRRSYWVSDYVEQLWEEGGIRWSRNVSFFQNHISGIEEEEGKKEGGNYRSTSLQ